MTQELPSAEPLRELHRPGPSSDPALSLREALRRARLDDAEQVGVQAELRALQIVRLELLHEAIRPLLGQIPGEAADLFDAAIMPSATPRLFIDMIGFVEMGRDSRLYRLMQDTRHARLTIAESVDVPTMVEAITQYVARRLLEREKALASASKVTTEPEAVQPRVAENGALPVPRSNQVLRWSGAIFAFLIDLLGAVAFFMIIAVAGWMLWNRLQGRV